MRKHRTMKKTILLSVLLFCLLWSGAFAQVSGLYNLMWWTIDNGAGQQNGGTYVLEGSVGQPDVGKWHGGQYDLTGGFWAVGEETSRYYLYIPFIGIY